MQINIVHKEDARAIAEKITARNYKPEKSTQKSKGKERITWVIFFPGHVMKNKVNFQLDFNLPTYVSNSKM